MLIPDNQKVFIDFVKTRSETQQNKIIIIRYAMGVFFEIGVKPLKDNYGNRSLDVGLNRSASDALQMLFDESLQEPYPKTHEIIMEVLVLDQISFADLSKTDFNIAVQAIRDCITSRKEPTEWQFFQKNVWEAQIEPLVQQDERYQQN